MIRRKTTWRNSPTCNRICPHLEKLPQFRDTMLSRNLLTKANNVAKPAPSEWPLRTSSIKSHVLDQVDTDERPQHTVLTILRQRRSNRFMYRLSLRPHRSRQLQHSTMHFVCRFWFWFCLLFNKNGRWPNDGWSPTRQPRPTIFGPSRRWWALQVLMIFSCFWH